MTSAAQAPIPLDQSDIHYLKVREGRFVIVEQEMRGQTHHENISKN